jgi:hypothetical protein
MTGAGAPPLITGSAIHPTYSGHQLMADEWERVVLGEEPSLRNSGEATDRDYK